MYKVYAITDIGKERTQNQDGFMVDGICCADIDHREIYYESDATSIHVAVCDGVGSTEYATFAVEKAQEYIRNHLQIHNESELEKLILEMNSYVFRTAKEANREDSACTIAGVCINSDVAYIYNIGDSPAFSVNNGYLEKHTIDDTGAALFGDQCEQGETLVKAPLIQSIGTYNLLDIVHIKRVQGDKAFLICSDGITDMLSLDEMEDILAASNSIKEVAQAFIDEANSRGGYDNSTVIILVDEED